MMVSQEVPLLRFFFVRESVVSYLMFVLWLFVPPLSFFWCLDMIDFIIVAFPKYLLLCVCKILIYPQQAHNVETMSIQRWFNDKPLNQRWIHNENTPIQIYWKFHHQKTEFSDKKSDIIHISAQNIDCVYSFEPPLWGGFNEYSQSMFLSRYMKNSVYPCKPQFYYIKVVFEGVKII